MTLALAFVEYLFAGVRHGHEAPIADELALAGLETESELWTAWCEGQSETILSQGPWADMTVSLGSKPPSDASVGRLWFDVVELATMIHVDRAWLSVRPTAKWQMHGFLEGATTIAREVQITPPYQPLDPKRLTAGERLDRVTNITEGEATLYNWFFGKMLPHLFDWQEAEDNLPAKSMRELWCHSSREWVSTRVEEDEGARVFVTPSTIQWDPDEVVDDELKRSESQRTMLRGEFTRDPDIGFRSSVLIQSGLLERVSAWHTIPENVRLAQIIDRSTFG